MKLFFKPVGSDGPYKEIQCAPDARLKIKPVAVDVTDSIPHPQPWQINEQPIWSGSVRVKDLHALPFYPKKYPRKLKKALAQMWTIKEEGNITSVTFRPLRKTKWHRKALKMAKISDDYINVPMKDGRRCVICKK